MSGLPGRRRAGIDEAKSMKQHSETFLNVANPLGFSTLCVSGPRGNG